VSLLRKLARLGRLRCPWCQAHADRAGKTYREVYWDFHGSGW
jgi:hypothetical protein